jgi:hypothetical protein
MKKKILLLVGVLWCVGVSGQEYLMDSDGFVWGSAKESMRGEDGCVEVDTSGMKRDDVWIMWGEGDPEGDYFGTPLITPAISWKDTVWSRGF